MLRVTNLSLPLTYTPETLRKATARALHLPPACLGQVTLVRRAVDARKQVHFIVTVDVTVPDEAEVLRRLPKGHFVTVSEPWRMPTYAKSRLPHAPVVVGCGPAGLFAAWVLAQAGLCPIVLERGQAVSARQQAIAQYHETGVLNPECNVLFGEGGAGTFSDGKLNTGTKDPRIRQVLQTLVDCGAPEEILWDAKPHIGTDRLAECIPALRARVEALGGVVQFGAKLVDMEQAHGQVQGVVYTTNGQARQRLSTESVVLAMGHSARDGYAMLQERGIPLAQKAFSLGLRVEHLQADIDRFCYGSAAGQPALGAASYRLAVHLPDGRGVYSFCMCPGGVVQAAASEQGCVVTNGMSYHARDGRNANSALLVGVTPADFGSDDPLAGIALQRQIEQAAFAAGGGTGAAPVCLLGDFLANRCSTGFGRVQPTYPLGTTFALPDTCLPPAICAALRQAIPLLNRQLRGFDQPDAVLTAPETRSSAPVRILRDGETLMSTGLRGCYPCGEGAGYAGGIVSAAVDGIRCAEAILQAADAQLAL